MISIKPNIPNRKFPPRQELSIRDWLFNDNNKFPCCYLFKNFWIEISNSVEKYNHYFGSTENVWEVFIYKKSYAKTVIKVGVYNNRFKAAIEAEEMILKMNVST